jgi:DNA polymerase III delta prime subunit
LFENIIGHKNTIETIAKEISSGQFPSSVLITGNRYSGKTSIALEIARVLSCKGSGEWGCTCNACRRNRLLVNEHVVFLGSRYFSSEIAASIEVYRRNEADYARFILIRAIRKCTRRFDPFLWHRDEAKLKPIASSIEVLEDFAESIMPGNPRHEDFDKRTKKVLGELAKMNLETRLSTISVDQVRNLRTWCHESAAGLRKVIIIERAQSLSESAANALLKILEEPPENVFFILLEEREAGIPITILSRLRKYELDTRSEDQEQQVLKKIFRLEEGEYKSISDYLLAWRTDLDNFQGQAKQFLNAVLQEQPAHREMFKSIFDPLKERELFLSFLQELQKQGRSLTLDLDIQDHWNKLFHQTRQMKEMYNQNPVSLGESLYYRMRNVI